MGDFRVYCKKGPPTIILFVCLNLMKKIHQTNDIRTEFPFGPHKGKTIDRIPKKYLLSIETSGLVQGILLKDIESYIYPSIDNSLDNEYQDIIANS